MAEKLIQEFVRAIEGACEYYDRRPQKGELIGFGLMCSDEVDCFFPCLLDRAQLPADAEPDYRFNPVDWGAQDDVGHFDRVNALLKTMSVPPGDPAFDGYVRSVFDSCLAAVMQVDLRGRFGNELFVTVGGTDPSDLLEAEERRFAERANSQETFASWRQDFG